MPIRRLILIAVGGYLAMLIYAGFFSSSIIFQPYAASYRDSEQFLKMTSRDGARITAVYLPNPGANYSMLYCHGNAEDLGDVLPLLEALRRAGFSVFAFDYQGYGTSQGAPSEQRAYEDADAAYAYLTGVLQVPADRILIMGHSLGGGVAVDLALRRPAAGLIVQSSFTTAFRVLTRIPILPFDKFRNIEKIRKIHIPVLVIHGTADPVIPLSHGQELFAAANEPKRSLWVERGDHNNLPMFAGTEFFTTLREFASLVSEQLKPESARGPARTGH